MESNAPQDGQCSIFDTSESDLVRYYLLPKVLGRPKPGDPIITLDDAYEISPEKIIRRLGKTNTSQDDLWFFYTTRTHKEIYDIRTANGFYSVTVGRERDRLKYGVLHEGQQVGLKRMLRFFQGKETPLTPTEWCIIEYRASTDRFAKLGESADMVLCMMCNRPEKSDNPSETEESSVRPSRCADMDDDNPPQTSTSCSSR